MNYEVIFHTGALREFDKLPKSIQQKIAEVLDGLSDDPRPRGVRKLESISAYRIRVGDYRIAYTIEDDRLIVLVVRVGHRKDLYKDADTIRQRIKS